MNVLAALLLSYLAVLLLPVAVFGVLYTQIEKVMEQNANHANLALIEQAKQVVDGRLDEMHLIARNITSHPKLDSLLRSGAPSSGTDHYAYLDFMRELARYRNSSSFVSDFYVYFRESDMIVTPSMKSNSAMFYSGVYGYDGMTYEQWKTDILHVGHYNGFLPIAEVGNAARKKRMLTFLQALPFGEKSDPKGMLAIFIDERQIAALLEKITKASHGTIYIKDASGQVIMSYGGNPQKTEGDGEDGGRMMTLSVHSAASGWEYVSVVPEEVFWAKVNGMKRMAIGVLVVYLIAGAAACVYMTYRAYNPLRDIIRFIRQSKPAPAHRVRNEYDYIKSAVADSFEKQTEMAEQLSRQTPVIRSNFIARLLKGYVNVRELSTESLAFMGVSFPYPCYCVAAVGLRDASEFIRGDTEGEWALIRFVTGKVAEEIPFAVSYPVEIGKDLIAVVLNMPEHYGVADLYDWADRLQTVIGQRFKTSTTVGISSIRHGLEPIASCFAESMKALEYSIFTAYKPVLLYEEMRNKAEDYYDFPLETEIQLINAVKSGDNKTAESIIRNLYRNNFGEKPMTPELGRLLFANLVSTLFKLLNALNLKYEDMFGSARKPLESINEAGSVEELYRNVCAMFEKVCLHVQEQRGDAAAVMLEKIKSYIDEHHGDAMIGLVSIADHFNITPPYLSAFFKKHSGTNLTDYLAQVRIERSKQLMKESKHTISQIARSVGYANDVGFIRVFKKYEGITPGKYRDMLRS
ncbi:helix-turn-helix domain-containing protein [Paenibacillus cisolokensis]|uniref:AraC family transcriptional regulator n=1 Tax=Paenibacillus cisolokensis TaxID=1658519 RepID=UPI003D2D849C